MGPASECIAQAIKYHSQGTRPVTFAEKENEEKKNELKSKTRNHRSTPAENIRYNSCRYF